MTTIIISKDITATVSERKARQWDEALKASDRYRQTDIWRDWEFAETLWMEEVEAWERFFS